MQAQVYPLTFTPVLRDYVWGGRSLESLYGRQLPPGVVAESWEISGHPGGATRADGGYWEGRPLPEILEALGETLVGQHAGWALERNRFPLLVKLLDARENLSVQVHPGDEYALAHENGELGKTEMWYVLHAEPGSELILGVQPGTTGAAFKHAVETGQVEHLLRRVPVHPGQAVSIPAGTVHALLGGVVATEIQQNSDSTYRLYDWGRTGPDGRPRPLHLSKALDVIDFGALPPLAQPQAIAQLPGLMQAELARSPYFVVEKVDLTPGTPYMGACDGSTLEIWGCLSGEVTLEWAGEPLGLRAIRYTLLPAALGEFRVTPRQPSACLRVYLPEH